MPSAVEFLGHEDVKQALGLLNADNARAERQAKKDAAAAAAAAPVAEEA